MIAGANTEMVRRSTRLISVTAKRREAIHQRSPRTTLVVTDVSPKPSYALAARVLQLSSLVLHPGRARGRSLPAVSWGGTTEAGQSVLAALVVLNLGASPAPPTDPPQPVLCLRATSHLDSQWNWTVQDSIRPFVPATFFENFKRFEQFPHYTFNYEGVIHYMWFK